MKKIKILMVGLSDNLGGIETYLINFYRKVNKEKFEIKFLVFKNTTPCFYEEVKNDLIYVTSRKDNYNSFKNELKDILLTEKFDYVHCNLMSFSLYEPILYALKYSNAKIVLHSHVSGKMKNNFKTELISSYAKRIVLNRKYSDRYIFLGCSQNAIDDLFGNYYKKNKCFASVVNNGIDVEKFLYSCNSRKKIRDELNISDDIILIGHVGRFTYAKNHKKLLSVFNYLSSTRNNFKLLLIGDGELKSDILNLISNYKINDKVIILSNISNINDYLAAMDCFVFPSIFEGLGIAVVEAQASGLPCIISSAIPNEIELTKSIYRCNINDSDEKWGNLIADKSLIKDRSINVNSFKEFDSSNSVVSVEKIYIENINKGEF